MQRATPDILALPPNILVLPVVLMATVLANASTNVNRKAKPMTTLTPSHSATPEYLVRREAAKRRDRFIQIGCLAGAVVAIFAAALLVNPIDDARIENQMTLDQESLRGLPPEIALLSKTGTFRALAIDIAFIRLENLKSEDKYYELQELSELICKLSPRFPSVWKFSAWNLAYNISVAQYTPEGRWYWVKSGIELLRDQGIPINPKSIGLYLDLAYIYWHKVGDFLDDQHWHYKKEVAVEMERILGPPPVARDAEDELSHIRHIAEAPDLDTLIESDPEVAALVRDLSDLNLRPDLTLLEFVARNLRSRLQTREVLKDLDEYTLRTELQARVELLTDPKRADARDRFLAALRKQVIKSEIHMDPEWMLSLMEQFGPLDWRSPYTLALYWSSKGDIVTRGRLNLDEVDSMNTVRYVFFGLALTIKRGRIILEPDFDAPENSYIEMLPDSRFIPHLHGTYLRLGKEQFKDDPRFREGTSGPNYWTGHVNFLSDGIRQLYTEGGSENLATAQALYDYLKKYNVNDDGSPKDLYKRPLVDFVLLDFIDDLNSFKTANMIVGAWLRRSLKWLSLGDLERAQGAVVWAKTGWNVYMDGATTTVGNVRRQQLSPLPAMFADATYTFLSDPTVPTIHKVRLWRDLGDAWFREAFPESFWLTRHIVWDRMAEVLFELAELHDPPLDPVRAFPEPPGMEDFRANPPDFLDLEFDDKVDHGVSG
jgi:hypothetical protein